MFRLLSLLFVCFFSIKSYASLSSLSKPGVLGRVGTFSSGCPVTNAVDFNGIQGDIRYKSNSSSQVLTESFSAYISKVQSDQASNLVRSGAEVVINCKPGYGVFYYDANSNKTDGSQYTLNPSYTLTCKNSIWNSSVEMGVGNNAVSFRQRCAPVCSDATLRDSSGKLKYVFPNSTPSKDNIDAAYFIAKNTGGYKYNFLTYEGKDKTKYGGEKQGYFAIKCAKQHAGFRESGKTIAFARCDINNKGIPQLRFDYYVNGDYEMTTPPECYPQYKACSLKRLSLSGTSETPSNSATSYNQEDSPSSGFGRIGNINPFQYDKSPASMYKTLSAPIFLKNTYLTLQFSGRDIRYTDIKIESIADSNAMYKKPSDPSSNVIDGDWNDWFEIASYNGKNSSPFGSDSSNSQYKFYALHNDLITVRESMVTYVSNSTDFNKWANDEKREETSYSDTELNVLTALAIKTNYQSVDSLDESVISYRFGEKNATSNSKSSKVFDLVTQNKIVLRCDNGEWKHTSGSTESGNVKYELGNTYF